MPADRRGALVSGAIGFALAFPAILLAIGSAGAGHGDYVVARLLFPLPMLLAIPEGRLGVASLAVGLVQFPLYGVLAGRATTRRSNAPLVLAALAHAAAAIACFAGVVPGLD